MAESGWCLPFLRWMHRFNRPDGIKYPLTLENKLRNYFIGRYELGMSIDDIIEHFSKWKDEKMLKNLAQMVKNEMINFERYNK